MMGVGCNSPDYECLFKVRMQVNQIQDKREKTKMPKAGFGALDSFLARS